MKNRIIALSSLFAAASLPAATVIDVDGSSFALSGATTVVDGSNGTFVNGANATTHHRWASDTASGTTRVGTTIAAIDPALDTQTDYYFNIGSLGLTVPAGDFYVQINYSLAGGWDRGLASDDRFALNNVATGITTSFTASAGSISAADGSHSIIVNLTGDLAAASTLNVLRWDFFNKVNNTGGKTYTMESLVFAEAVTAVPEPSTFVLGALALFPLLRRRR